jgi:hypothetical protein
MTPPSKPAWSTTTVAEHPASVFADFRLETGGHRIQLVGDGQSLVLHTDNPLALLAAMNQVSLAAGVRVRGGRRALGRVAGTLTGAGLRVDVRGPGVLLVSLGDGAGSRVGRLLTGSPSVGFGSARDVVALLSSRLRWSRVAVAAFAGAAAGVAAWRYRRR